MSDSIGSWQALQALENRVAREEVRAKERVEAALDAAERLEVSRLEKVRDELREARAHQESVAESLDRRTVEGDERLREHIEAQVIQIQSAAEAVKGETHLALEAAERLEVQRIEAVLQRVEAVRREVTLIQEAAAAAVEKVEAATEKRFEGVNEFRAQLSDQATRFLPREVAEAQFKDMRDRVETQGRVLDRLQGGSQATERREDRIQPWMLWAAGTLLTIVVVASNLLGGSP